MPDEGVAGATVPVKSEEKKESTTDVLAQIASKGPIWVRGLALVALLLTTITPYWQKVSDWIDDEEMNRIIQTTVSVTPASGGSAYSPGDGTKVPAPADAHSMAANALSPEDSAELTRHIAILQEMPHFKRLLVSRKKSAVAYSVFPSDGCILINHTGHSVKLDLVRSEESRIGAAHARSTQPTEGGALKGGFLPAISDFGSSRPLVSFRAKDVDWDRPDLKIKLDLGLLDLPDIGNQDNTPMQGSCLNPHPGPFRYWSQPVEQCIEQVWRQFGDGCTHYQIHNSCNNAWDPLIHWTYCAMH